MMRPARLSDAEIDHELCTLPGWTRTGDTLVKRFVFTHFPVGIGWVNRVAEAAERMQHHPDLDIRYTAVTATLSTHDVGGITTLDFSLAREMETLAA
jgi:4a-hydroxytetrahydrobiopterin dehydratase